MTIPRILRILPPGLSAGLAVSLWLSASSPAWSQSLSSGSGAGSGTGSSGGTTRNSTGTGEESGLAPSPVFRSRPSGESAPIPGRRPTLALPGPPPRLTPEEAVAPGPGVNVTFPDQEPIIPLNELAGGQTGPKLNELSEVTDLQLNYARRIPAPGDRSLSLSRIASAATFSNQLDLADTALAEASRAGLQMTPGLVQDQRLMSIIVALLGLAEARIREGKPDAMNLALPTSPPAGATDPAAAPGTAPPAAPAPIPKLAPAVMIRRAQVDFQIAADLSARISNPTYRSEMMYKVAEAISFASQAIVNEYPQTKAGGDQDKAGLDISYEGLPDAFLQDGATIAQRIERPVWHDQALVRVSTAAAESKQFSRALTIARMIPEPEVRANALLKIGEIQARRGDPNAATPTFHEAALAVASIVQDDPRSVLTGVLIDDLVTVGRFEDARRSVVIYPDEARRRIALGAIIEAMGARGAAASALEWINTSAPADYRSHLYKRLNSGVVAAIQANRSRRDSRQ